MTPGGVSSGGGGGSSSVMPAGPAPPLQRAAAVQARTRIADQQAGEGEPLSSGSDASWDDAGDSTDSEGCGSEGGSDRGCGSEGGRGDGLEGEAAFAAGADWLAVSSGLVEVAACIQS